MSEPRLSSIAKHLILPEAITATGWPAVAARCQQLGITFDRWQTDLGTAMLAKRADGLYAAGVGGVQMSIPRQIGKTFTVMWMLFGLAMNEPLLAVWTAHRTRTANETFEAMRAMANRPAVAPFIKSVRAANGQQHVEFTNGSRILFGARESGFGRGFAGVDMLILDEAQILSQKALDDMVPATNTAANPLIIRMGTPPKPTDTCEAFTEFRAAALAGSLDDGLYVELGASDDADPDDRRQWHRANPSFPRRTPESAILRMRRQLGEESFRREALGIWDAETVEPAAIPWAAWQGGCVDEPPGGLPVCWAVRFSVDGSHVALGACARIDGSNFLADGVRQAGASEGTAWLVEWLTDPDRLSRTAQIVVDGKAGAGWMVDQLRSAGVASRIIWTPRTDQVVAAHAMMLAAVKDGSMRHRPGAVLDEQVRTATKRPIGSAGGFGWRTPAGESVALLDAVTLAHWACRTTRRRPRGASTSSRKAVIL